MGYVEAVKQTGLRVAPKHEGVVCALRMGLRFGRAPAFGERGKILSRIMQGARARVCLCGFGNPLRICVDLWNDIYPCVCVCVRACVVI